MVKVIAKRVNRPFYYVSKETVGRNETAIDIVILISFESSVNGCWDGRLFKVMILPDVAFGVEDGNLPVEPGIIIVFNIHHLTCHRRAHRRAIFRQYVDAMVKVCVIQGTGIELVGAVEMPHLLNREWPAVTRMRTIRIACGNTCRAGLDGAFNLLRVLGRKNRGCQRCFRDDKTSRNDKHNRKHFSEKSIFESEFGHTVSSLRFC